MKNNLQNKQRGGTMLGLVVGVLFGLGVALAVAVYITKVPVSFANKGQVHTPEHDAAEVKKNKDWNPNVALQGKSPAKAASSSAPGTTPAATASTATTTTTAVATTQKADKVDPRQALVSDPLGDLAKAKADAAGAVELFSYYVQAGAFRTLEEAEQQRARLSLMGMQPKVSEREQAGRPVFRVRLGPYDTRDDAEKAREKFDGSGIDTTLVRIQR